MIKDVSQTSCDILNSKERREQAWPLLSHEAFRQFKRGI